MTQELFREDAYLRECAGTVTAVSEQGIVLGRTVFYPLGGGQAGDCGVLILADGREIAIADTRKGKDAEGRPTSDIMHVLAPGKESALSPSDQVLRLGLKPGDTVTARIDWERR